MDDEGGTDKRPCPLVFLLCFMRSGVALSLGISLGISVIRTSGFLGDYSQLKEGRADQAQLIYIDSEADFSGYLPAPLDEAPRLVAFLGSTIGNLYPEERRAFLAECAALQTEN